VNEKNEAIVRPVVVGDWVGKDWIILEGLNAGDKVIIDNIIKLRPGAAVIPNIAGAEPDPELEPSSEQSSQFLSTAEV